MEDCLNGERETSQETGEDQQGWGGGAEFEKEQGKMTYRPENAKTKPIANFNNIFK